MFKRVGKLVPAVDFCTPIQPLVKLDDDHGGEEHNSENDKICYPNVVSATKVPFDVCEPGILTGYRDQNHSLKSCIRSLLKWHNETLNIWTQIIPALYFFSQLLILDIEDNFIRIYLATTTMFLLTSACAHTFGCMSSRARHICFLLDYAGIALYSCGCSVCYYAYALPSELMKPSVYIEADFCDLYLFFSVSLSVWSTHLSGITRFWKPSFIRKVVRLGAFVIIWLYLAVPVIWRIFHCTAFSGQYTGECTSIYLWTLQFMSAIATGLLYVTHFPERWFPGKFDIVGHSHQIFHIFGASAAFNQYRALIVDYFERKEHLKSLNHSPSLSLCLLCIVIVIFSNLLIFFNFYRKLNRVHPKKQL